MPTSEIEFQVKSVIALFKSKRKKLLQSLNCTIPEIKGKKNTLPRRIKSKHEILRYSLLPVKHNI